MAHRGPETKDLFNTARGVLGFGRLSLTAPLNGGQPFRSRDSLVGLVANGEVYNHSSLRAELGSSCFSTESDCEVLLRLYERDGLQFLDRVEGMFAVLILDAKRGRLILARDRFGIKPVYFHQNAGRVVASSEIKALFRDPETPRALAWDEALSHPMLSSLPALTSVKPTTWFDGIETIEPGTILEIDLDTGRRKVTSYWTFPGAGPESLPETAEAAVDLYRDIFVSSVRDCATSDAGIGVFLSGGVDSSAVCAVASSHADIASFSVVNAGTVQNGDAANARAVAGLLGIEHHDVLFDPDRVPTVDAWRTILWLLETPLCGPEVYYRHELHRYAKEVRPDINAILLGGASDEFNGGYQNEFCPGGTWSEFVETLSAMRTRSLTEGNLADRWFQAVDVALVKPDALSEPERILDFYFGWEYRKIQQYNMWHEDRTAAGSGIEARVPFLDRRLVELSVNLPDSLRPSLLADKRILRDAVVGLVPEEIAYRPKVPFFYGPGAGRVHSTFVRMLAQDGAALVREAFEQPAASERLSLPAALELLQRLQAGADSGGVELLLRLVNLGLLEAALTDLPAPHRDCGQLLGSILPRLEQEESLSALDGVKVDGPDTSELALASNVEYLIDASEPSRRFVCVDGAIEFEVDSNEFPVWASALSAISVGCSLGELKSLSGWTDQENDFLQLCFREGIVLSRRFSEPA